MKPPMHPEHVEAVHSVGSATAKVQASCSCGWTSGAYKQGQPLGSPTVARLLADELNTHCATYTEEPPYRPPLHMPEHLRIDTTNDYLRQKGEL